VAQFRKDTHQYLNDGQTIFETVMLADQYGHLVGAANPSGMAVDAFGRARSSQPYTLFESSHRYSENGKINSANSNGTHTFNANLACIDCTVNTANNAYVYRESKRVFSYQPGKSLQGFMTFVMNPDKTGLRQRAGLFTANNGVFLERSGNTAYFVKRSFANGTVVDTKVPQSDWNIDKLDGTGPSLKTLNLDNPQIFFYDIEWLGVGSIRYGFVIDGQLIHCHTVNHANQNTAPKGAYMQTACLPLRIEIENTGNTASNSTLKQICATLISEGGYEPQGSLNSFGQEPVAASQVVLTSAGTYYPVLAFRLHADKLDSIVLPKDVSFTPISTGYYKLKLIQNPTLTGAVWANVSSSSPLEYNTNAAATISGGTVLHSEAFGATNQSTVNVNIGKDLFRYQFERNSFTNTAHVFVIAATCSAATANCIAQMSWEEVTV